MATHVSNKTVVAVRELLRVAGTAMTTKEIALALGKSYEAVRQAIVQAELVTIGHGNPKHYALGELDNERRVKSKNDGLDYVVTGTTSSQISAEWNKNREAIVSLLAKSEIAPGVSPGELALRFGTASGVLAQLAYDLYNVADKPDWYEILTENE